MKCKYVPREFNLFHRHENVQNKSILYDTDLTQVTEDLHYKRDFGLSNPLVSFVRVFSNAANFTFAKRQNYPHDVSQFQQTPEIFSLSYLGFSLVLGACFEMWSR